ncbi:hypothetical protein LTR05_005551 [Lithohypha guttulata]|uniref:Transmembrane protein n=1 Tax=Lithohypha guttulata TaxID=1690604 RepID=A0AAN7SYC3_9EURO|nr:hypothetical protein LTR05_005551 [Lithohypha guttulata]
MSADSLAVLRKSRNQELAELAEQHLKHDLTDGDRDKLKAAASTLSTATTIGTLAGLGLGIFVAYRVRSNRTRMYQAFRAREHPTHVRFASGREEAIPDITPMLKPSTLGDVAAYSLFAAGGVFVGGETGLLIGASLAQRPITNDPETRQRIEKAFRSFRADVLKKEIEHLEGNASKRQLDL